MNEVKILGAGVSGLTSAISLAKAGYNAKVFDRAQNSGRRFSGDLQGLENWTTKQNVIDEIEEMKIKTNFYYKGFSKIVMSNGIEEAGVNFREPMFYLVKRGTMEGSLDQALKVQALDEGAEINFNSSMTEKEADVIATGPNPRVHMAIDKGIVFETEIDDVAIVLLNNEAAYKGYSYLLVADGYGCMCTVVCQDLSLADKCWNKTQEILGKIVDLDIRNAHGCGGIADFMIKSKLKVGKRLYVGEAAGIQDALWGFGIRSSMVSGYLASKSIIHNLDYKKLVDERLTKHVKASVVNRFIWEKIANRNYGPLFNKIKKIDDALKLLNSMYSFSLKQRVLFPFAVRYIKNKYKLP